MMTKISRDECEGARLKTYIKTAMKKDTEATIEKII
jgi:hypothetical protein